MPEDLEVGVIEENEEVVEPVVGGNDEGSVKEESEGEATG